MATEKTISNTLIRRRLTDEEGLRLKAYKDSEKKLWHIGIGHLLEQDQSEEERGILGPDFDSYPEDNYEGFTITQPQAFDLFEVDVREAIEDIYPFFTYEQLEAIGETRYTCIIEMCFQMGASGLRKFKNFKQAVLDEDWEAAAHEMVTGSKGGPSKWMRQTPDRCQSAADAMRLGYFAEYKIDAITATDEELAEPPSLTAFTTKELLEELLRRNEELHSRPQRYA